MKVVVLNAGSGSLRCSLFDIDGIAEPFANPQDPVWEAIIDSTAPGQPPGKLQIILKSVRPSREIGLIDSQMSTGDRVQCVLKRLWEGDGAPLDGSREIDVVGHRVVHGGDKFSAAVRFEEGVEEAIEKFSGFAPLHNPPNLEGFRAARTLLGAEVVQMAVFDTAFHRTLPESSALYAGPYEWKDEGIRRYGFHGTNFRWVSGRAAHLLQRGRDTELRLILCHLGGGCSLCATRGGQSIDTTMGFTPLDGIAMCTRSGAIDPGILIYLQRQGRSADEIEKLLNKNSGLKGLGR